MFGVTTSDDKPIAWIGRYPIRCTAFVVGAYVLGMFGTVILQTAGVSVQPFAFHAPSFVHGAFWQPLTCTLLQQPNFFFLFNMLFLYWSSSEVEKFLGRRRFLLLLALLLTTPPAIISIWSLFGIHWIYGGPYELSIGMFIAFAALYPNVEWFGWITLKWLAFAGIVLASMQHLPQHAWGYLSVLWTMCAASFLYIRSLQERISAPAWLERIRNSLRPKPKFHVVPKASSRRVIDPEDDLDSIDPVLEKISRSGIGSLTASERRALDRARARLLKKSE
jgi:hypothetical protein